MIGSYVAVAAHTPVFVVVRHYGGVAMKSNHEHGTLQVVTAPCISTSKKKYESTAL